MISVPTTKSNSNWLDRLRSLRGFPTGEEPDLHQFLSSSSSGSVPTTESTRSESTQGQTAIRDRRKPAVRQNDDQWLGEVSNVLSELFNMGESSSRSFSKKRSSRKQENPRYCGSLRDSEKELCSSDDLRREKSENGLASSGDNSLNERRENNATGDVRFVDVDVDVDVDVEGRENVDLKAYSRNEVLVIDTSLPNWKFDGWVFRKNDEWKIKEKKSRSRSFVGKKRKLLVSTLNDKKSDKDGANKMKNKDGKSFLLLNKGQSQNDRKEEPFKKAAGFQGKVSQNRFPCPRPSEKPGNEGSSVILLKSIPLNDDSIASKLGKSSRKRRPKKMKIV